MREVTLNSAEPTPDEVRYLEDRIYEFNSNVTGIGDGELLAFFVREGDRIIAGICGDTWGGTCEVRQFWVEKSLRNRGFGTKLFQAAEQEARRRGCTQIILMTFSFQAPGFYRKHGFEVVAAIDDHPHGHQNVLMRKRLKPPVIPLRDWARAKRREAVPRHTWRGDQRRLCRRHATALPCTTPPRANETFATTGPSPTPEGLPTECRRCHPRTRALLRAVSSGTG